MSIIFEGNLADRSTWTLDDCSISMTMDAIGNRSTIVILREALYGTTRFDDFVRRTKTTDAIVATRLKHLTELGLLTKEPYQEPGQRTRYEYLLTDKGKDLLPALFALKQWGDKYLQPEGGEPLRLVERATGEPIEIVARSASATDLGLDELAIVANGALAQEKRRTGAATRRRPKQSA
ncbi:helix-turn-helix transcriptional regulator [Actinoplanes sp. TBRC 11911]|uniref:winged helix-turn-helix transcriptional regulator n=1 Tax=Actinoplanes sp. TBRC 11911 TaxID=2729386 RepID=UPI00145C96EB|nr:helix-turn-helix domain-containing protein [Actinoplanes sp. TBRC 11911]NMO55409.1 helix-turn-helix transcriptional regulator [Actinoplanes sp. TBRC 11911]